MRFRTLHDMTEYDFSDDELHDEPVNKCPDCGTMRWFEAGSSNMLACHECGYDERKNDQ